MDAVILAAGYGERMRGIVPQYWKPMMLVEGEPVVTRAVYQALDVDCNRIIVVVSPQNAAPMTEILPQTDRLHMVVQRNADGPGDAMLRGLELAHDKATLVLMGDNVSSSKDIAAIVERTIDYRDGTTMGCLGIRALKPTPENTRFTRRRLVDGVSEWVEKVPYEKGDFFPPDRTIRAWVGPITVDTVHARNVLRDIKVERDGSLHEVPIGPYLSRLIPDMNTTMVTTLDIGTPEVAREVTTT